MNQRPEAQQQPPYPQQYPPHNYGPPYFQPYPPPKRDAKKILTIILIIIIIALVLPTIMAAVLYLLVIDQAPSGIVDPSATWGPKTIISSTEVHVDFGKMYPEERPVDVDIILVRNGTAQGRYSFGSNDDGVLVLVFGTNVGTLFYDDLADNGIINIGDRLRLTNLSPESSYKLIMILAGTGDQMTSTSFSTPE